MWRFLALWLIYRLKVQFYPFIFKNLMQLNKVYAIDIDRSKTTSCHQYVPFYILGKDVFLNSQRRWQLSSYFNLFFSLFSLYLIEY